ncbi:MAG TPA: MFS transporter, partial [Streptosporangiaceae bacterium]|nr:MFS transporter [Streptosporangiaceae bacterium]
FYVTEMRAAEPMMPLHVYRNRNFSLSMAMTFLAGLAMFGALTFLPLFQQTVQGASPTLSGLMLTPMMLGVTVTSIVAGQVTTKTGRYKIFPILGGGIMGVGMYLLTVAAGVAFYVTEMRAAEPMMPLHVYRNRNFSLSMAMTFLAGLAMFGALTFLPLYQQTVQGASPTVSGLMLTPMMLGVTVTSIVAGQVTTRTGRYKIFPILGGGIMGLGLYLLTNLGIGTTRITSAIFYVVLGLGMGFLMQMVSLIAQNSVEQKDMGVASSARMFFQQIGGSLGVAAFGAVFARKLTESLASAAGSGVHISASGGQVNPATVNSLPAAVKHDVFFAIAHAVQSVFIWALPAAVLIFVLALFIKEVPLRGRIAPPEAGETASQQPELVS